MGVVFHGESFAGYRIVELIGCTALATVYRAVDPVEGRTVALKVFDSRPDELARQRFLRESATARDLRHAHIVPIHEVGEAEGRLFVAMRWMRDGDLGALLAGGQSLAPDRAVALLTEVAGALDTAHAHGLVHGDLKPSNILVETTGGAEHAFLTDFGNASYLGEAGLTRTSTGTGRATPEYMAPEQIEGVVIDARTDVYALGRVLERCLAAPAPRTNAGLDGVLARALAERRDDRYPSATALLAAVRQALADPAYRDPAAAVLSSGPAPRRPALRRSVLPVTALTATVLAAASGLAIDLHGVNRADTSSTASATSPAPSRPPDPLAAGVSAIAPPPSASPSALPPPTADPSSPSTGGAPTGTPLATPTPAPPPPPAASVGASGPAGSIFHATVRNTGQVELVAGAASLSPTTGYAVAGDGCAGMHLVPGGSCMVTVRFQPPAPGDYTSTLSVPVSGAPPVTFTLRGQRP